MTRLPFRFLMAGADGSHGDIIALARRSSALLSLLSSVANEREPAILHP